MKYYYNKVLSNISFSDTIEKVKQELKNEGFGVLTEIDIKSTLKEKLDVDFKKYTILGACNPPNAYKALQAEEKIGLMLPCNVIVVEIESGDIEVSAVDPLVSMQGVGNNSLADIAEEINSRLHRVIDSL
jgi:uncharacterized protein (DUF302 family)